MAVFGIVVGVLGVVGGLISHNWSAAMWAASSTCWAAILYIKEKF